MKRPSLFTARFNPILILITLIGLIAGPLYFKNNSDKFGVYICNGRLMTVEQVADFRGITLETAQLIGVRRSLTVGDICVMPQAKLERAIFRANNPKPDHPSEAVEFRKLQMRDENGYIPPDGLVRANEQIQQMLAAQNADIDSNAAGIAPGAWSWLGPGNIGGRVRSILIHPTNPNILWAGSVSGGIWKSTDGGASWQILTDFLGNMAVSTLVMDPNNPNVIYAGTGEGFYNIDNIQGAGVFKTPDGGATWTQLTATNTSNWYFVNRLAITSNGTTLLAATGSGIWRSTNAGANWTQVLVNQPVKDINFDPTNNNKAVASGSDGKAWYSTNGGASWTAASGLPALDWLGRVEVAYAPSNPAIVYAAIPQNNGELWKSTNGGQSYSLINTGANFGASWYNNIIWVDPTNPNLLLVGGIDIWRSTDGGATLTKISLWWAAPDSAHADNHMIIEDAGFNGVSNKRVYVGNDGGVYRTDNVYTVAQLSGWTELNNNLGITQFYGAAGNPKTGEIIGGTQDNGTLFYTSAGGTEGWETTFGGDGGWSQADPTDPNYFYGEYVNLQLHRSTNRGFSASYIYSGIADAGTCANFISPFTLDPNNPNTMLAGGCSLWRSVNVKAATPSWASIKSPAVENISAIAIASVNSNIIWVGHNNGDVYKTTNGAAASPTWTKMDTNSPGLPGRYVTRITIDKNDSNKVYVTFGGFNSDNVWRTTNGGANWTDITGSGGTGLPSLPVRSLVINPNNSNWLYAGTELGIFASPNGGANWTVPHDGPTNTSVDELFWMNSALVAATHGRGLFKIETVPCVTLTVTSNPLAGGSVSAEPAPNCVGDSTKYSQGTVVTLTASANAGYAFSSWGGDASGATTSVDVSMSADKTVTANFTPTCFTLTTASSPLAGGAVNASPAPNCVGDSSRYSTGTLVSLTAAPNTGFGFSSWSGDAGGSSNPTTVTMSTDRSVTANFIQTCFTLTKSANPIGGGSVDASPAPNCPGDPARYSVGTLVTLTASANAGYNFSNWSGDASGTTPSVDVSMSADKSVTANFNLICYTLTVSANPPAGGTVNANPAPNCNSGTQYTPGTTVSLSANANAGYAFASWSGDASGASTPVEVVMTMDRSVTANFNQVCYTLTLNTNPLGGGMVDANPAPNCNSGTQYTLGTVVSLTANANPGYAFASWSGDASGTINPVDVTMSADKSVTANFAPTCFSLTTNANPVSGGTVDASPAPNCVGVPTKYSIGTVVTLTANANPGYAFASWSGDASGLINPVDVTMSADRSVTANFDPTCFTLTMNANPASGGTVDANPAPNCAGVPTKYSIGTVVTLTANANAGYAFASWGGDASGITNPVDVTISADKTVTANFAPNCFTLTTNANPASGGTVDTSPAPNCVGDSTKYSTGTVVSLTANANATYAFSSWTGDASGTINPVNVTMTADKSVTANFSLACYSLSTSSSPLAGGTVNVSPAPNCAADPAKYSTGTVLTLTANANAGYGFASWSGDAGGTTNPVNVTLTADKSVTANFIQICFALTSNANPAAGGSVNASPAPNCAGVPTKYSTGTVVSLTALANTGYNFSSWGGDAGGAISPVNVIMTADKSVTANFSQACYTLIKASNPIGGGTVSANPAPNCNGGTQYTHGTVVSLTATANADYVFSAWSSDASGSINPTTVTMLADKGVIANFTSTTSPVVSSIARFDANPTSATRAKFVVTFSEPVTGVDALDFTLTTYGINAAWIGNVSGLGQTYTVTVNTGAGNGTLRLDVSDNDTIKDSTGIPLGGAGMGNGNFTSGPSYTVLKGATYEDVSFNHWAWQSVERLHNAGVTSGCWTNPPYYCPDLSVSRAQMAVFLLRAKYGSAYVPPAAAGNVYGDVPVTYWAAAWIERLAAEGITLGCGFGNYCPETPVTRGQMAVFLLRAKHGAAYTPPPASGVFADVSTGYWAAAWIEQLAAEGITSGCGGSNYCPNTVVSRAQMAVFLVKAFNLP